ncbi:MmcQ/YjbR family DNA-binding protein [Kandleria vitulina]|uniref:MmcQ/YjbR family DNA-binding protein n=1 Tax=Kandleria vitulina TaxID=1630 RepID=UPI00331D0804
MSIESEVFKKYIPNNNKLIKYGFKKSNNEYKFSKKIMNDTFRADIVIDDKGQVIGKVIEIELNEEYTNFRIKGNSGEFVGKVREEYKSILQDIANKCFEKEYFIYEQTNRITKLINEKYNVSPEFLWNFVPDYGVFRNVRSKKWFGIVMNLDKSKIIPNKTGEVEVLNLKLDENVTKALKLNGVYSPYHSNKKNWVSIILDNTLSDEKIMELVDLSYDISNIKGEWIIPANPKYYDIINAFNETDTIIWKQSNNIWAGDIVYLYVAAPISAILYKCEVLEVDIPYKYSDKNVSMKKVMKIKLLKRYEQDIFTFEKLKKYGIKAIRGPRSLTDELSKDLNS